MKKKHHLLQMVTDEAKIMFQKVLFIKMLLLHYATQSEPEMYANCYEDFLMMCPGVDVDNIKFSSVTWYRVSKTKHGIIRRGEDNETKHYNNSDRYLKFRFGEKHGLLIPSVTPEDSGTYECVISAHLGGQNKESKVHLKVNDCVNATDMTTMVTGLNTTATNKPDGHKQEDMPVLWSIIGYTAVGLTKIALSLISIWVIQAVRTRSSRRRQYRW